MAFVLAGCGGGDATVDARLSRVEVIDGDGQRGEVAQPLARALVARLLNAAGEPVAGQTVGFVVDSGGGSLFVGTTVSDAAGLVRERWTMGPVAGPQRVALRAVDSAGQAREWAVFQALAVAAAPDLLRAHEGSGQSGLQGQPLAQPVAVRATDRFGNPVPGLRVQFSSEHGGAAAPAHTDADGVARSAWTLGLPLGLQWLRAAWDGGVELPLLAATATPAPPGPPVRLLDSGSSVPFTATRHLRLPQPLQVRVVDALGNGVSGLAIRFTANMLPGDFEPLEVISDASGLAQWQGHVHATGPVNVDVSVPAVRAVAPLRISLQVADGGLLYDGVWDFSFSLPRADLLAAYTSLVLADHAWIHRPPGLAPVVLGSLDGATGVTRLSWRLGTSTRIEGHGQAWRDADGRALASGTLSELINGVPSGISGTWSARRRGADSGP